MVRIDYYVRHYLHHQHCVLVGVHTVTMATEPWSHVARFVKMFVAM